jgi:hypothetical protein
LLQQSGLNIPFAIGADRLLAQTSDFETLFETADLAPEVRVIFKKLAKRDSVTREKVSLKFPF